MGCRLVHAPSLPPPFYLLYKSNDASSGGLYMLKALIPIFITLLPFRRTSNSTMKVSPSRFSGHCGRVCLIFCLFVNLSQAQIFTFLNYVNDAQGGCAIERANGALLRNYQESQTLIQAGLQAIQNYGVDPEARRLVAAYFGIRPDVGNLGFSRPSATYNQYWTTVQGKHPVSSI